jgi:diguanylate cyclase (GGDEF)-like protein/PAS domain S-box-containing protein
MNNSLKFEPLFHKEVQQLQSRLSALSQSHEARKTALYESEQRFSLAMFGSDDGLWDWDLETDEIYYSPSWKKMLGYGDGELEASLNTWSSLVHKDDQEDALQSCRDYLNGNIDTYNHEMRMLHKNGSEVFIIARGFIVPPESEGQAIHFVGTHVDITARKKAEAYNDKNAEILEMIATGMPAATVYSAIALIYEGRHLGMRCSMLELHGNKLMHGGAPSLPNEYCTALHGIKNGPSVGSCGTSTYTGTRVVVENIDTDPKWQEIKHLALPHGIASCWSEPIKSSSGKVLGAFGMYYNHTGVPNEEQSQDLLSGARLAGIVMERDQAQKYIRELAYTDLLTGLASRAHFYQVIEEQINTFKGSDRRFGLLYIDLDDFKGVNDSLGHDIGDLLLKAIAKGLKRAAGESDFVARLSGDEFCILVEELDDYTAAYVAQRCLDIISEPVDVADRSLIPSCSIGIAYYPEDGENLSTLIKAADTTLYAAKELGKNQYTCYTKELTDKAEYRFQVEQYLKEAIEHQQLSLVYQPQFSVQTGEMIGVEALSRWYHPALGQVPPADFIPIAERIGMIKPLTEWVLYTACRQALEWKEQGQPALTMAGNISPSHFLDQEIVTLIKQVLDETCLNPAELELEVTESVVQTDQRNIRSFKTLKELGVKLAIDDFGTGYSSFSSLKHLNVDYLKIDKYFLDDMLEDKQALQLISSMIEMAQQLGYEIVAEGVENQQQLDILQRLGCEAAQGYFFSKPVSAQAISALRMSF